MAKNIGATLTIKDGNFKSSIKAAISSTENFKKHTSSATGSLKTMGSQSSVAGDKLTSLAKKALGVVTAYMSFRKIISVSEECIKKAQAAEEANIRLNTIMSQIPNITEEAKAGVAAYCKELSTQTTIGATAQKSGASQLASFQMSAESINKLMPQLNNLAVANYGVNVTSEQMIQSANLLGKAYSGQAGALSRSGIVMTEAQKKILKTGNDAQKSSALVEILNQNFGDLAKQMANSSEGKLIRIKNSINSIKTSVGTALLPVVEQATAYAVTKIPKIQSAIEGITQKAIPILSSVFSEMISGAEKIGPMLLGVIKNWKEIALAIAPVVAAIGTYKAMVGAVNIMQNICNITLGLSATEMGAMSVAELAAASAKGIHTAATGALTAAQTALNAAFLASPIGWIVLGVAAVVAAIILLYKKCDTFRNFINNAFMNIVAWAKNTWNGIKTSLQPLIDAIKNAFVQAWELIKVVWGYVSPYFKMVWENIKIVFSVVATYIGGLFRTAWTIIKAVWDTVVGYFTAIWNTISGIFSVVKSVLTGDWQGAWEGIKGIVATWATFFSGIWESIKSIFSAVGSWFSSTFSAAWEGIKAIFGNVTGFFSGIWNTIKNMFVNIGTSIGNGISGAFKSVVNSVIRFASNIINGFINSINGAIGLINKIPGVSIPKLGTVSLPQLANGGIIQGSGLVMVGERGPEILNLPKGASVTPLNKTTNNRNNVFNITINAGNKSADEIVDELMPKLKLALGNM